VKKKRALAASRIPEDYHNNSIGQNMNIRSTPSGSANSIEFNAGGDAANEMLRITPEGFYVRGVKLEQDEHEAKLVYDAFREWMTWAALERKYR